jgi:LEA14-like dessication related protein
MRKFAAAALGLGVAGLAACSALGRAAFQNPVVNLRDVRVLGLGTQGGNLEVQLGVYNPNNYRLDATRLTYRVFVGDSVGVANGAVDTQTSVQAGDSTIVKIPVAFTYSGIGAAAMQLMRTGSVNYRVAGDVTVGSVVGNFTVPYSATGQFNALSR